MRPRFSRLWPVVTLLLLGSLFGAAVGEAVRAAPLGQSPTLAVLISEVAWGGTAAFSADEWMELYNPGSVPINLTGWTLKSTTNSDPNITLTGSIQAGGFYLLERTDDSTISDFTADKIYKGKLLDSGEILELRDSANVLIDTANQDGGSWPAGSGLPNYASMERIGVNPDGPTAWASNDMITRNGSDEGGNPVNGTPRRPNSTDTPAPTPTATSVPALTVLINEVAWSGTNASADDEWIELYNPGSQVDLTGWYLTAADGSPNIPLSGPVADGGYYLLERTDDNAISDISADFIFNGELADDGETLRLLDPNGNVVDAANLDGGAWPAGSGSPNYASMERRGVLPDSATSWITNTGVVANGLDAYGNAIKGTPGKPNWAYSVTPTATTTSTATRTLTPTPTRTPTLTATPTRTPTIQPIVLVINEFLPHPHTDWNGDGVANVYDEYIEIMNVSTEPVSLKNWKLDNGLGDSSPYKLPDVTLEPRAITRFFRSDSGLPLSDGGATVRLLKPDGQTADIYTYPLVEATDITWCRLPDGNGVWTFACRPTPGRPNVRAESSYLTPIPSNAMGGQYAPESCLLADTLPEGILQAECGDWRAAIWNWGLWGEGEEFWLESRFKWGLFIQ
jgi:hypothetical protein